MKDNDVEIILGENSLSPKPELPFQLPRSLSFERSDNPRSMKSQAVDSLINQNEDLTARLRAAIKRAGGLEDQLDHQIHEIAQLKHERAQLQEQILILNEKESLYRDRTDGALSQTEDLKQENRELVERLHKVERAFRRLFKYREKIRDAMPDLKIFKKKALRTHELNEHLKVQVSELSNRLQRIHSEVAEAQTKLVEDYEIRVANLQMELTEAREKLENYDAMMMAHIELENRSVELERQLLSMKSIYTQENSGLKADNELLRKQTKELLVSCETQKSQLSERILSEAEFKEENSKLVDQVDSLQVLWREKQAELERSQEKIRALQKLNQDISIRLNETKKQMLELKTEAEKAKLL